MIADIGGIVAGPAKSRDARRVKIVVKARDPGDVDLCGVEHFLAARDRLAMFGFAARAPEALPILVEVEDIGVERQPLGFRPRGSFMPMKNLESSAGSARGPPVA